MREHRCHCGQLQARTDDHATQTKCRRCKSMVTLVAAVTVTSTMVGNTLYALR